MVAGMPLLARDGRPVLVIDEDATLVIAHSEKGPGTGDVQPELGQILSA